MIFTSPYYKFNKKYLKIFDLKSKEAPVGNLIAAVYIMQQNSMPQPAKIYKEDKIIGLMYKGHCFFTDKGLFIIDDQLNADFFSYQSIKEIDVKKSFTSSMEIYFDIDLISGKSIDLIDFPIKSKAAERILNLKDTLKSHVMINDIGYKSKVANME